MDKTTRGWINGFLGVLIFSGSLPATRVAVMDFDPVFLTVARASRLRKRGPIFTDLSLQGPASGYNL